MPEIMKDADRAALSWRERFDADDQPCYLSAFIERIQGRYLVHRNGRHWRLSFDRIGSQHPEPLTDGPLDSVCDFAVCHASAA